MIFKLGIDPITGPKTQEEWNLFITSLSKITSSMEYDRDLLTRSLEVTSVAVQETSKQSDGLKTRVLESEAELRALISSSPLGLLLSDAKGNISYVNRKFCDITGYNTEDAFNKDWLDYIHPDDKEEFLLRWQQLRENPQMTIESDIRFLTKNEESSRKFTWGNIKMSAIAIKNQVFGYLGTVDDINDRKKAESLLIGEKQILEMMSRNVGQKYILESTLQLIESQGIKLNSLICETSPNSNQIKSLASINLEDELNRVIAEIKINFDTLLKEVSKNDSIEMSFFNLFNLTGWNVFLDKIKDFGYKSAYAMPIQDSRLTLIGLFILLKQNDTPPDSDIKEAIEFFNDLIPITIEKKNLQIKLEDEQMRMISASKMASLGEMAGGIAHEVMNPIAIIDGFAARIQRMIEGDKIDSKVLSMNVEKIRSTVSRVTKIITSLRTFARDGENDSLLPTKISEIIDDTLEFCNQRLKYRKIELKLANYDKELKIKCQQIQISQVLLNLLNNATDALEDYKEKWIKIEVLDLEERIQIRVIDSGKGIPADLADKIMRPYFTTKAIGKGTGLGLSLSKSIIESHKGSLTIDRNCSNTCFVIELPKNISTKNSAA